MTVTAPDSSNPRIQHNGSGTSGPFATPKFLADTDLLVIHADADGAETTLTIVTDFTVSGGGDGTAGDLTTTGSYGAIASGTTLIIINDPDITQPVDYAANDAFPAETHEGALDRATFIQQRLDDKIARSLVLVESAADPAAQITFPGLSGNAGYVPSVHSGEAKFEFTTTVTDIAAASANATAAAASATAAAASETAAAASETAAAASETAAGVSETNAAASAVAAEAAANTIGFVFTFDNATADADPGAGEFRFDNATPASAGFIYVDNVDVDATDVTGWLDYFDDVANSGSRGTIVIRGQDDTADLYVGSVTGAVTDGTGYRKIVVTGISGSGAFTNGEDYLIRFAPAGADGSGDVTGPASATDSNLAAFDGTTGKLLKDGGATVASLEPAQTAASQAEAEAGTEAALRSFSPLRVAQAISALASSGGIASVAIQAFTGSGTYTPTSGMTHCIAFATGGGGGGGGADELAGTRSGAGGGGGAGGTGIRVIDVATIGASQTVTIGAAGAAGSTSGGAGGAGGDTTLGALLTGSGGSGGGGGNQAAGSGGAGGAASSGDLNTPGGRGGQGFTAGAPTTSSTGALGGFGGAGLWGGGGSGAARWAAQGSSSAGSDGSAYGSGGGGAAICSTTTGAAGGAGAAGCVFVVEFVA